MIVPAGRAPGEPGPGSAHRTAGRSPARRRASAVLAVVLAGLLLAATFAPAASAAPNMVVNPGLTVGTGNTFDCFQYAGWGQQTHAVQAVAGRDGTGRAARITISAHADGDRKLITREDAACGIDVRPGTRYDLAAWYTSSIAASFSVFRHSPATGWAYWWVPDAEVPASPGWVQGRVTTPPVPAGTDMIAWGLGIAGNGVLTMDDLSQVEQGEPVDGGDPTLPPPPDPVEGPQLVKNGLLATGSVTPDCFQQSGWGDSTATVGTSPDVRAGSTGRSWRIDVSRYASGDHKLVTAETPGCAPEVQGGQVLTASAWYRSTAAVEMSVFLRSAAGVWQYWYVPNAGFPPAAGWTEARVVLPPLPAGTDRISFGLSLAGVGSLSTHDYGLVRRAETPPATPAGIGRWSVTGNPMPLRAMHATLLRDGRVLLIAGSGNDLGAFAAGSFRSAVFDPAAGTFLDVPTPVDMFCAGHATLPDGRVLIQGGTQSYPGLDGATGYEGIRNSYVFDPATNRYAAVNDSNDSHWYPTLTRLETGDVWMAGGLKADASGSVVTELFDARTMRWKAQGEVPQTWTYWGLYPHMFLMSDARLFYSGAHTFGLNRPGTGASVYDWRAGLTADVPGLRDKDVRDQAGSVLLPPAQDQRVMIVGGGHSESSTPAVRTTDIIDLKAAAPRYRPGPDLPGTGKMYVNLTTLPDRTVLASNGGTTNRGGSILTAALFDARSDTWTSVGADPIPRNYHSVSVLLKDGRVAVFGSNPGDGTYELRVSLYEPPYLFKGPRPTVSAPATLRYGAAVPLQVTGAVTGASLTSLRSATHQSDPNERLVDLPLTGTGAARTATVPTNSALLPPGPYLLTVLDDVGVPSVATTVYVAGGA